MINIISNLSAAQLEGSVDNLCNFNQAVAWSLHDAFTKMGVECRLVRDHSIHEEDPPIADHSLLISSFSYAHFAPERWTNKSLDQRKRAKRYADRVRNSTKDKVTLYIDSNYHGWDKYFDLIFTVVEPAFPPMPERWWVDIDRYVYAGWGADPDLFYPEKDEKTLFLDTNPHNPRYQRIYDIYAKVIPMTGMRVYQAKRRLPWSKIMEYFRKSHYYCDTHPGESALTRIEAATSGALLVIPKPFYKERTVGTLEHVIWDTEEQLMDALNTDTDPQKIREKALEHSWLKTAERITRRLQQ